jgi:hypothetical protein
VALAGPVPRIMTEPGDVLLIVKVQSGDWMDRGAVMPVEKSKSS